ncbi:MAG: alpha/beta hydrolase fold domain-containing protein [Butyrivibrio sp.]|nr:alpha/beta hydrolase fold domain-containing protein [Butyrivibrio sp.]
MRINVDLNLYLINDGEMHPLVINIHGGAFIAGDADTLDTQSNRISKNWNVNVVTVRI